VLTRLATVLVALGLLAGGSAVRQSATNDAAAAGSSPGAGAAGIGDPYFPEDGNGGIDVRWYEIHDRYRFTGRLSGWTRLTLRTIERLRSFDLDFLLPVSAVHLSTGPATYRRADHHELRIQPRHPIPSGRTVRVTVHYAGHPSRFSYSGESNWVAEIGRASCRERV